MRFWEAVPDPNPSAASPPARRFTTRRPDGWVTTGVLGLLAGAARLLYWWSTAGSPLTSDSGQYHELATNLANGEGFAHRFPQLEIHATAFRPPVFPWLLSNVYRVAGDSPGLARGLAVAGGVVLVVMLHRTLRRHVSARGALLGTALVAVYPPLVANDTVPLTETVSLILIVVLAHCVVERRWLWAGALCGLLILTRPSAQGLVVVLGLWLWRSVGWRRALGSMAVVVLVVMPWVVRNQVQVGEATVVTSNGFNLAALYSPEAEARGAFVDPVYDPGFEDLRFAQFDEADWNRQLRHRALENLRANPWQVGHVVTRNLLAILELKPSFNENAEEADVRNMTVRTVALPAFYLVTCAGAMGLISNRRNPLVLFLAVAALYFLCTSLFFVAPPRLRAPLDLACCVGAGLLLAAGWSASGSADDAPQPAAALMDPP